jgi:hypothetical protein
MAEHGDDRLKIPPTVGVVDVFLQAAVAKGYSADELAEALVVCGAVATMRMHGVLAGGMMVLRWVELLSAELTDEQRPSGKPN